MEEPRTSESPTKTREKARVGFSRAVSAAYEKQKSQTDDTDDRPSGQRLARMHSDMASVVGTAYTAQQASSIFKTRANQNIFLKRKLQLIKTMRDLAKDHLTVAQIFRRYVQSSTLHGFIFVCTDTYLVRRVLWALLMIGGALLFVTKLHHGIATYFNYPFSTKQTLNHVEHMDFPAISLCPVNQFRSAEMLASPLRELYHRLPLYSNWSDPGFEISGEILNQELNRTSLVIDDLYAECNFESAVCSSRNFSRYFSDSGQVCFTFNSGKQGFETIQVSYSGVKHKYEVTLDLSKSEVIKTMPYNGIQVIVHDQKEPPVSNRGFMLSTGRKHYMSMQKVTTKNLPPPYSTHCGEVPLKYHKQYNQRACLLEKLTNYTGEKCKCREVFMADNGLPVCSLRTTIMCMFPARASFDEFKMRQFCPIDCQEVNYVIKKSHSSFIHDPPKGINTQILKNQMARKNQTYSHILTLSERYGAEELDDYITANVMVLMFYYGELTEVINSQVATYTFYNFLGDTGGTFAIMLGASLLTFAEFIDLFVFLGYHQILRLHKKKLVKRMSAAQRKYMDDQK